jgi:hypothetical protein
MADGLLSPEATTASVNPVGTVAALTSGAKVVVATRLRTHKKILPDVIAASQLGKCPLSEGYSCYRGAAKVAINLSQKFFSYVRRRRRRKRTTTTAKTTNVPGQINQPLPELYPPATMHPVDDKSSSANKTSLINYPRDPSGMVFVYDP